MRLAASFAWGKGRIPRFHEAFEPITHEQLEAPLGVLDPVVIKPISRWFEAMAASKQYAIGGRLGWPIIESFWNLALAYPIAMWMLRMTAGSREPTLADAVDVVRALDRGLGFSAFQGRRRRRRLRGLAKLDALPTLIAWFGR